MHMQDFPCRQRILQVQQCGWKQAHQELQSAAKEAHVHEINPLQLVICYGGAGPLAFNGIFLANYLILCIIFIVFIFSFLKLIAYYISKYTLYTLYS
jgi:hypothetical protein